jgi:CRISPR-associated protein Cst2
MFITGILFIDAPASALNNAREATDTTYKNEVGIKVINTSDGKYPYVSAQAFRYWLRSTLNTDVNWREKLAPIFYKAGKGTAGNIAYTAGNPIEYWDDDLFGYMRAEKEGKEKEGTEKEETANVTRTSPFRVGTFVSISPINITKDFGTMTRHLENDDGNPVPHQHQFYRAILKGLFSIDLYRSGRFSYRNQSGSRNLDSARIKKAEEKNLSHSEALKEYCLPIDQRVERVTTLISGLARLEGGAKQAIHYTDVNPVIVIIAVIKGGNNPLQYIIRADALGRPKVDLEVLEETLTVWKDQILSNLYIGWVKGFYPEQRFVFKAKLEELKSSIGREFVFDHPRVVLTQLINDVKQNPSWFE